MNYEPTVHEIADWLLIGSLVWGAFFGVAVLFLMGAHREDPDDADEWWVHR